MSLARDRYQQCWPCLWLHCSSKSLLFLHLDTIMKLATECVYIICANSDVLCPVLEDRLRHRVNVSIEDFRAHIQEVFYEQFGAYRESAAQEPTGIHTHMVSE